MSSYPYHDMIDFCFPLSPAVSAYDENQVTLRFAATVKNIKLKASKTTENKTDAVKAMADEISKLRDQLKNASNSSPGKAKVDPE